VSEKGTSMLANAATSRMLCRLRGLNWSYMLLLLLLLVAGMWLLLLLLPGESAVVSTAASLS
jgi:hypothetical protein